VDVQVAQSSDVIQIGQLQVRIDDRMALGGTSVLKLSVREFELLVALAERSGRIVSREDLHTMVWGGALRQGDRSIDVYVRKLRVKLEAALPDWNFIHTHVGFGYRLAAERAQTP
jgi:DNA-binding response OmpR family regulator